MQAEQPPEPPVVRDEGGPSVPPLADGSAEALQSPGFLHPSSIVFEALSKVRQYIVPAIIGVAGAAQGSIWGAGFAAMFFAGSLLATLLHYFTLRYCIQGHDFIVTEGLLFRRVRSVPIRRIQNMDLVQNPLHRLFGVAEVNIETASGTKPEATLRVLTHGQIEQLRTAIFGDTQAFAPDTDSEAVGHEASTDHSAGNASPQSDALQTQARRGAPPVGLALYAIPTKQLVLAGLASNRGLVLLGVAIGFLFQGNFDEWFGERLMEGVDGYLPTRRDPLFVASLVALAILTVLVILRILGVGWYLLRFYGYQLTRHGEDLRIACGLFTRVSATIPRRRIQFISVHRSLLMRWLGLAAIRIETAGGAGNENENAATTVSRRWFLPVISESEVNRILAELRPALNWEAVGETIQWHGVSPLTGRRLARKALLSSLLAAALGLAIYRPWGWVAGAALFPLLWTLAQKKSRARRYAATDWGIAYQSGLLTKKLSFTFYDRIQTLQVAQSFFDRRWSMATLQVDTAAAGPAEHSIDIHYLDEHFANAQYEHLRQLATRHCPAWS